MKVLSRSDKSIRLSVCFMVKLSPNNSSAAALIRSALVCSGSGSFVPNVNGSISSKCCIASSAESNGAGEYGE